MRTHSTSKKTLWVTVGGIAVFVIGAVLGSFLVLGAKSSDGKSFSVKNLATVDLSHQTVSPRSTPQIENYTKEFSKTLLNPSGWGQLGEDAQLSDALLTRDMGPLVEDYINKISRLPENTSLNISHSVPPETYLKNVKAYLVVATEVFIEISTEDIRLLENAEVQRHYQKDALLVEDIFDALLEQPVPPQYEALHTETLIFVHGLTATLDTVGQHSADPARTLLLPASTKLLTDQLNSVLDLLP